MWRKDNGRVFGIITAISEGVLISGSGGEVLGLCWIGICETIISETGGKR